MICPQCNYAEAKETILFSSVEVHCINCQILDQLHKAFSVVKIDNVKINGCEIFVKVSLPINYIEVTINI